MNFAQSTFLIASIAVAIPVIVHLLSRRQVRLMELGTMRFLHQVIEDGAQRRRIRRWLLLAVRCLVMLLLAFLFARPYLTKSVSGRSGNHVRVILIDRSSSMAMRGTDRRLIDDAVAAAAEAGDEAGSIGEVIYAWFDRHVEPIAAADSPPRAPRVVVGSTDYGAAIRWARNLIDARPGDAADVVLITDLQRNGLRSRVTDLATDTLPADVPVRVIDVGREAVNNLAIVHVEPEARRIALGQSVRLNMTLFNYGSLPLDDVTAQAAAFREGQSVRVRRSVNIGAGEAAELQIDLGKIDAGRWQITASVDVDDDHVADNQRLTAVDVVTAADVLVLDSERPAIEEMATSYHLTTALAQEEATVYGDQDHLQPPADDRRSSARFDPRVIFVGTDGVPALTHDDIALAVVADAEAVPPILVQQLADFVNQGGRLLVFAGDLTESSIAQWQQAGLSPGKMQPPVPSGTMPWRIVSVDESSGMMSPFGDPQHADLSRLSFRKLLPVEPNPETEVLAWFDEGRPAITRQTSGRGQLVWFLSSAGSKWSNWTASPLYLPLVQQMAADLLNLTGEGPIRYRNVGDEDSELLFSSVKSAPWIAVSTGRVGRPRQKGSQRPAVSTFTSPGFQTTGDVLYVINGEARESDPARITPQMFVSHFGLTLGNDATSTEAQTVSVERRVEYWPWLAAIAFVFVFAEFCLSNRTTA